ncbi:MAG: hypothetical protein GXO74_10030 [Calditrichaeota bacterium]|nr:hypothetical protein [Calditrichota bacterium]
MKTKLAILLSFFLFVFALSSYAQTGKIWGYVFNGSEDSSRVANAKVEVLVYKGHQLIDDSSHVAQTGRSGKFTFSNLKIDTTLIYYPRTNFHDVIYYGNGVRISKENTKQQTDIVVYDSTTDKSHISIQMDHIFIEEKEKVITVREILLLQNTGTKTFTGSPLTEGGHFHVFEFPLPEKFENVQILTPQSQGSMTVEGNMLIDTGLFPPGMRQLSFQYDVPNPGKSWHFSRPITFPTGSINIFLSQPDLIVEGPGIVPMGDFPIRDVSYQRFAVQHVMPGMPMEITLKNLSAKSIDIKWIVLGAVVLLLLIGFGYTMFKAAKK